MRYVQTHHLLLQLGLEWEVDQKQYQVNASWLVCICLLSHCRSAGIYEACLLSAHPAPVFCPPPPAGPAVCVMLDLLHEDT